MKIKIMYNRAGKSGNINKLLEDESHHVLHKILPRGGVMVVLL